MVVVQVFSTIFMGISDFSELIFDGMSLDYSDILFVIMSNNVLPTLMNFQLGYAIFKTKSYVLWNSSIWSKMIMTQMMHFI